MATRFKYQSLAATGAAPSFTNLNAGTLDYDSGAGFARLTATGSGAVSRGWKIRTLASGAIVEAVSIASGGSTTLSADSTTAVLNAPTTYTALRFNANGSAKGFVGFDKTQVLATATADGDMVLRADGGAIHFTSTTAIRTTMAAAGNWTMSADTTTLIVNAPTTYAAIRFNLNGVAKGFLGADKSATLAVGTSDGDMVLRFDGSNLRFAALTGIVATLTNAGAFVFTGAVSGITTLAGTGAISGFTTLSVSGASSGFVTSAFRNTTAGTGAGMNINFGNDASAQAGAIWAFSSTYTSSGANTANGTQLYSGLAGGLTLFAEHASGTVRIYAANTLAATWTGANTVLAGSLATVAPTGGAGVWKLGIANVVSPTSPNRTITIDIGGTLYYLAAKTTND